MTVAAADVADRDAKGELDASAHRDFYRRKESASREESLTTHQGKTDTIPRAADTCAVKDGTDLFWTRGVGTRRRPGS